MSDEPISEDDFFDDYGPLPLGEGESMLVSHAVTLNYPTERVWTVVEGSDGALYASPGYHRVNVVDYVITEHPWTDPGRDAVYHRTDPQD